MHGYNLRRRENRHDEGDWVWRRNYVNSDASRYYAAKLAPEYVGPFKIKKRLSSATYLLVDKEGKPAGEWNVKDLKKYVE